MSDILQVMRETDFEEIEQVASANIGDTVKAIGDITSACVLVAELPAANRDDVNEFVTRGAVIVHQLEQSLERNIAMLKMASAMTGSKRRVPQSAKRTVDNANATFKALQNGNAQTEAEQELLDLE